MSKITVTTIAGQTSGSDANLVKIESGDTLQALSNATVGGTLGVTGALSAKGGAVFNEDSADVDFRVESNGNANMLFVDGGNDNVNIGTNSNIAPANGTNLYVEDGTIARFGLSKTGSNARKFSIGNAGTYLNIYDETLDAEVFRIDNGGRVTKPSQPAFAATNSGDITVTTDGIIAFDQTSINVGNHFNTSTNRFTAPVAGTYLFLSTISMRNVSSTGTYLAIYYKKNNSGTGFRMRFRADNVGNEWDGTSGHAILNLAANDYVELFGYNESGQFIMQGSETNFTGYLLQ